VLKSVVLNNLGPITKTANYKENFTKNVCNFCNFIKNVMIKINEKTVEDENEDFQKITDCILERILENLLLVKLFVMYPVSKKNSHF